MFIFGFVYEFLSFGLWNFLRCNSNCCCFCFSLFVFFAKNRNCTLWRFAFAELFSLVSLSITRARSLLLSLSPSVCICISICICIFSLLHSGRGAVAGYTKILLCGFFFTICNNKQLNYFFLYFLALDFESSLLLFCIFFFDFKLLQLYFCFVAAASSFFSFSLNTHQMLSIG